MKEKVIAMLKDLGNDVIWIDWKYPDPDGKTRISVDFDDFDGFDEDWSEEFRDFDDEDKCENFIRFLRKECKSMDEDFYSYYYFEDFYVRVGYTSYDI